MNKQNRIFTVIIATLVTATAIPSQTMARDNVEEFAEAQLYFELNNTDGDLGIHGKVDGGPWEHVRIMDPKYRTIMLVRVRGQLKKQGMTELFFESAEPPFDELSPNQFFNRFREGEYKILGWSQDGKLLRSLAEIRHVMPAPPNGITINGIPDEVVREKCDDEDPAYDPTLIVGPTATINWDPVTTSHPGLGKDGDIEAQLYQVVVETELEIDGEEFTTVYSVDVPPDITSMTIPAEFLAQSDVFKYEILVKEEEGGNQTAIESCFAIVE